MEKTHGIKSRDHVTFRGPSIGAAGVVLDSLGISVWGHTVRRLTRPLGTRHSAIMWQASTIQILAPK